jgi:hypothetical protein
MDGLCLPIDGSGLFWKPRAKDNAQRSMHVGILLPEWHKFVRMEVMGRHTVGSVIETIRDELKMPASKDYSLDLRGEHFGRQEYKMTMQEIGVSDGEHMTVEREDHKVGKPRVKSIQETGSKPRVLKVE